MPTATLTPTEQTTSLRVALSGGRSVVRELRGCPPLGLRELRESGSRAFGGAARVALVQTAAMLVGGDDVRVEVVVEAGAALELSDISATLAHQVQEGSPGARMRVAITVQPGARLAYAEQPLVVADGALVDRRIELALAAGAVALHRDTLVLGRHGEPPGVARLRLRVARDGVPILDETISTADRVTLGSPAVLGAASVVGSLGLYGAPAAGATGAAGAVFSLGPVDTLVRRLAVTARELAGLDALHRAWSGP